MMWWRHECRGRVLVFPEINTSDMVASGGVAFVAAGSRLIGFSHRNIPVDWHVWRSTQLGP